MLAGTDSLLSQQSRRRRKRPCSASRSCWPAWLDGADEARWLGAALGWWGVAERSTSLRCGDDDDEEGSVFKSTDQYQQLTRVGGGAGGDLEGGGVGTTRKKGTTNNMILCHVAGR